MFQDTDINGSFSLGGDITKLTIGGTNKTSLSIRGNAGSDYTQVVFSENEAYFGKHINGTWTPLFNFATKGDLPNVKIIDLDSVRFVNSSNGPQMAFYPGKNNDGAFFFNIHIQRKELEVTRYNGTDWETLFKIQGS